MFKSQIGLINLLLILLLIGCGGDPTPSTPTPTVAPTSTPQPTLTPTSEAPPTPTPTEEPKTTRLNLAYGNLPTAIDPHRTSDQFAAEVLRFVCQGLTSLGGRPLLATGWEYAPDNLSVTFTLRQGIQFPDGTPFDSEAVRFSFERLQQPESEDSPFYQKLQNVKIETSGPYTVTLSFDEPRDNFLEDLSIPYAAIISPSSAEIATDPICTGPYQVKEWEPDQFILLTKNPNHTSVPEYFENKGPAHIDEIKIYKTATHEKRFQALLEGRLDINHINTGAEWDQIKDRSDMFYTLPEGWSGGITYLGFRYDRVPTNDPLVRQALAHAVHKDELISRVLDEEFAIPAVSLLSPRTFGYSDALKEVEYSFDLERSKQLLAEAGFADSDGDGILERDGQPLNLLLLTTTDDIYLDMATGLQERFSEIGVGIEIRQEPRAEISKITPTGELDLLLYDYNWELPSAINLFLSCERVENTNRVGYCNPEVDRLLDELAVLQEQEANEEIQLQKIIDIQKIIIQDAPWQPILARQTVSAINSRVTGVETRETRTLLWHDAKIVE